MRKLPAQEMVESFQNVTNTILSQTFQTKSIIVSSKDRSLFNERLIKLKRLMINQKLK